MKTMKKLLSIILSLSLCLGLTSPLSMVVSVRANATHTWRNSTLPLFTNLKDGDTVQISQSPSGTLRVPENCTITITGGSESMPVGSSNLIGFNIPETSKVVWKAFLRVDSGTYGVELIGNGTFEVADGLIEHRGGCSAVIHARIMQNYPNSADIIINGGKVHSRNNPTTAVVFNVTGNVIVNGGTLSIGEPASSPRTILAGPEHMREDTAIFINRGAIVSAGISSYGDNSVIIRRGAGTLTEYEKGSSADLTVSAGDGSPLDSSMAVWDLIDDVSGISYSRNDNSGFFAVPDVQVIPPPKIYVNDVYVTEPTVLRIKNAIDEALADENIDEVKITGKFTNADSVLEFSIPENKKVIWDAVYELPVSDRGRTILATGLGKIILTENADIITHGMNQSALAVSDNGSANATKFTMNGGKLTAGTSTQSSVCALELFDGATAVINAGALQNNTATRETIDVWRNAVLVVNGGSIRNREIGAVHPMMIRSQNNSVVFVTGGEFFVGSSTTPIASGGINEYTSATNFIGYYTGNNGAKFNSTDFSNDDNLFKIDGLDFNGYTYDENTPHVGAITVTFSDRLTFQSATGTDDALRVKQDDNNLIFSGTSNAPDITLEITGSLENGKVPVEFTTAPFGLNIDWCEFCERAETECVCERCELCRKEPIFCDCVIIKGEKYLKAATHLDLSDKGLTIADLTPLTEFPNLVYLDLSDNPITLQQIAVLEAALPNCNIIHNATEGCAVCGRHEDFCDCIEIKGEKYLKAATHLDLSDKGLTSADLTPLSQFPNLTSLDLRDNPITLQQIAELEAALPNCNIIHNATEGCAVCGRHEDFCDCIEIKGEKY
ncbi:MAG: hypothetical protein FWH05_08265, partial [Oscillospiraceae bacterium]|nr:hypothetical protein [Oscillospiraceae bacterium]